MSALEVLAPFQVFGDVDGEPLEDGYIYVGVKNLNPEVSPVQVYWDSALTIPAPQPIRTLGGYPSRMGTPSRMYVDADSYSISVKNKNGTFIYSLLDSASLQASANVIGGVQVVDSISDLRALAKDSPSKNAFVAGYYAPGDGGGGNYYYDSTDTTSADNGGTIIVATDGGRWKLDLTEEVSVKQFGAVSDYDPVTNAGTDNTSFIQSALDYVQSIGGSKLYIPAGYYKITAALSYDDAPLVIQGDGSDNSYIVQVTVGANALNFTSTIPFNVPLSHGGRAISLCLYDLSIASPVLAGTAVNVVMQDISSGRPFLTVRRLAIKSLQNTIAGFNFGIYGYNLNGTSIDEYYFEGDVGNSLNPGISPYSTTAGIRLTGDLTNGNVRHTWSKLVIVGTNRGVWVDTWYEGFYVNGFEFGLVGIGFLHQGYLTALNPNTFLENGQIDAKESAVVASNVTMLRLANVDCFKGGSAPIASQNDGHIVAVTNCERFQMLGGEVHSAHSGVAENGINLIDCQNWSVIGTDFVACDDYGLYALNSDNGRIEGAGMKWNGDGILLDGTTANCVVEGNTFREFSGGTGYCVVLAAGVANNFVTGNFGEDIVLMVVNNATGINKVFNNSGVGAGQWDLVNLDTSPSVGSGSEFFNAANSAATTIQTFDNGYDGQKITIFASNGNTTLQHAAGVTIPIFLSGSVNVLLPALGIIQLLRTSTGWYEISRSF